MSKFSRFKRIEFMIDRVLLGKNDAKKNYQIRFYKSDLVGDKIFIQKRLRFDYNTPKLHLKYLGFLHNSWKLPTSF